MGTVMATKVPCGVRNNEMCSHMCQTPTNRAPHHGEQARPKTDPTLWPNWHTVHLHQRRDTRDYEACADQVCVLCEACSRVHFACVHWGMVEPAGARAATATGANISPTMMTMACCKPISSAIRRLSRSLSAKNWTRGLLGRFLPQVHGHCGLQRGCRRQRCYNSTRCTHARE